MNRKNKKETKTETTSREHRADSLKMITDQTQEKNLWEKFDISLCRMTMSWIKKQNKTTTTTTKKKNEQKKKSKKHCNEARQLISLAMSYTSIKHMRKHDVQAVCTWTVILPAPSFLSSQCLKEPVPCLMQHRTPSASSGLWVLFVLTSQVLNIL